MILYHASNCIVDNPDVLHSRNFLDFGKGFYMTSLEEQARKYALRFLLNEDKAYLNYYDLDDDLNFFVSKNSVRMTRNGLTLLPFVVSGSSLNIMILFREV